MTTHTTGCTCGRDEYTGPGATFLSHAPNCQRPIRRAISIDPEAAYSVIERAAEDHRPADDWKCHCGEDLFGGSAGYSWALFKSHFAGQILAVLEATP